MPDWTEATKAFWEKHEAVTLSRESVAALCASCAEHMDALNITALKVAPKQIPQEMLDGLCERFAPEDGFFTRCVESSLGEFEPADQNAFCAWLHNECLGKFPAEESAKSEDDEPTVAGPFFERPDDAQKQMGAEQIAFAAVLVPGEPDSDGEVLRPDEIERVAHTWLEKYQNVDLQHSLNNVDVVPVESYITPSDMGIVIDGQPTTLPAGSWVMAGKARDPEIWGRIERGELAGFSVMGVRSAMKSADAATKRVKIRDLGPDWVAPFVSVVDRPAVPKAKWFALKGDDAEPPGDPIEALSWWARAMKEGRRFSDRTFRRLKEAMDTVTELVAEAEAERAKLERQVAASNTEVENMDEQAVKDLIEEKVSEAIKQSLGEKPLAEQIAEAVKAAMPEPGSGNGSNQAGNGDDPNASVNGDGESDAMKAMREEIEALKAAQEEDKQFRDEVGKRLGTLTAAKSRSIQSQDGGNGAGDTEHRHKTADGAEYRRDGFGRSVRV